ncbi:MAG: hypothetical protein CM1200mP27_12080 [Chloroflexota bacterium]|nr:MAG: hypothetical protein CM1200mP27_12080 [Chloroflexota bacterium]
MEDDHEIYLVVTRWENKSDFLNWTQSASFKESHAGPHPAYIINGELANYEKKDLNCQRLNFSLVDLT